MKVKLLTDGGYDLPHIVGKIVEATPDKYVDGCHVNKKLLYKWTPINPGTLYFSKRHNEYKVVEE
jgi:hypothetical protein